MPKEFEQFNPPEKQAADFANCVTQLMDLERPKTKVKQANVKLTVVIDIPVDPNTNEYVMKVMHASSLISGTGLLIDTVGITLPDCMKA